MFQIKRMFDVQGDPINIGIKWGIQNYFVHLYNHSILFFIFCFVLMNRGSFHLLTFQLQQACNLFTNLSLIIIKLLFVNGLHCLALTMPSLS